MAKPEPTITAFAPATVANVMVGFDVLGFALEAIGDRVTVSCIDDPGAVEVIEITGVVTDLPTDPKENTAAVALKSMLDVLRADYGFRVSIEKGIPLSSGMGGSAASAVGAVVAANHLLEHGLSKAKLLECAAAGEAAASGAPHADNVGPCLHGGLTAVVAGDPPLVVSIPVPDDLLCVLVHPLMTIETREARAILQPQLTLDQHVRQSQKLAGFLAGCFRGDRRLISRSMVDLIIEPQRSGMIPGFEEARKAARDRDAIGFGIAGSGPSVFAWVGSESSAQGVAEDVKAVFGRHGVDSQSWISAIHPTGAEALSE